MMSNLRLKKLQKIIPESTILFITKPSDIFYFTGFEFLVPEEKEAYLIVSSINVYLLHASFNPITKQSHIEYLSGLHPTQLKSHLMKIHTSEKNKIVMINKKHTTVYEFELFSGYDLKINEINQQKIDQIKTQKDSEEIIYIKKACQISRQAFENIKDKIKTGQTEKEVQNLLEKEMEKLGSEKVAFPTIVAFGKNGAQPHHQPTDTKLLEETPILIDFGATYKNYRSDMTRSFWFGKNPTDEFIKVEKIVKTAYQKALDQSKDNLGKPLGEIDLAARQYIKQEGYGDKFIHTTGHGLGLEIHEPPSIYWKTEDPLLDKTVFTIEPGIYLEEEFGYRYENTILVDKDIKEKAIELTLSDIF